MASVLVVEDDKELAESIKLVLESEDYNVKLCYTAESAIKLLLNNRFDLVLVDLGLPGMGGWELCHFIRKDTKHKDTPIIIISGNLGTKETNLAIEAFGVEEYISKPFREDELIDRIEVALKRHKIIEESMHEIEQAKSTIVGLTQELKIKNEQLQKYIETQQQTYIKIITSLLIALEAKDRYTRGHSDRVTKYSITIAKHLGINGKKLETLKNAAMLHDIGKIVIDLSYINKPGKLTNEEWQIMKLHPVIGAKILQPLDFLKDAIPLVKHHHERWDGSGYPDGIKGDKIDILTGIISVADAFDAMTTVRAYRDALPVEIAISEIEKNIGKQFHPEAAKAFLEILRDPDIDIKTLII